MEGKRKGQPASYLKHSIGSNHRWLDDIFRELPFNKKTITSEDL